VKKNSPVTAKVDLGERPTIILRGEQKRIIEYLSEGWIVMNEGDGGEGVFLLRSANENGLYWKLRIKGKGSALRRPNDLGDLTSGEG